MTEKPAPSLIETYRSVSRGDDHPHLDPINAATFAAAGDVATEKASRLLDYQSYLSAVRADKARQKGATVAFERNVLAQAHQALADLDARSGTALRVGQQVNQTGYWDRTFQHTTEVLRQTGPVDARTARADIADDTRLKPVLADHGLTPGVTAAITEAISKLSATLVLHDGKVSIETRHGRRVGACSDHRATVAFSSLPKSSRRAPSHPTASSRSRTPNCAALLRGVRTGTCVSSQSFTRTQVATANSARRIG